MSNDLCGCGATKLYAGQRPIEDKTHTHKPDDCTPLVGACAFSCPDCQELYRITGDTPETRQQALDEWPGCCRPNTPSTLAVTARSTVTAGATNPRADRGPVATPSPATVDHRSRSALGSLLTGIPAWVRRRVNAWPFDPSDFTN